MAQKYCSRGEKCCKGKVLQDYSEFYRDVTAHDHHKGECKSCMAERRKEKLEKAKDIYSGRFKLFIG